MSSIGYLQLVKFTFFVLSPCRQGRPCTPCRYIRLIHKLCRYIIGTEVMQVHYRYLSNIGTNGVYMQRVCVRRGCCINSLITVLFFVARFALLWGFILISFRFHISSALILNLEEKCVNQNHVVSSCSHITQSLINLIIHLEYGRCCVLVFNGVATAL